MSILSSNSGIYCYENLLNGKKYIGQSSNLERRIKTYELNFSNTYRRHGINEGLWNAVKKYGRENFSFYILEYASTDKLNDLEVFYIKELHSHYTEHGYNIDRGGRSGKVGVPLKEKTKAKLRELFTGKRNPFYGKNHTKESKEKNRQAHIGRVNSESARVKMGDAARGIKYDGLSKYFGVAQAKHNPGNPWRAVTRIKNKYTHIGYFKSELEAAKAYDQFVIINNLASYPLNFPSDY